MTFCFGLFGRHQVLFLAIFFEISACLKEIEISIHVSSNRYNFSSTHYLFDDSDIDIPQVNLSTSLVFTSQSALRSYQIKQEIFS